MGTSALVTFEVLTDACTRSSWSRPDSCCLIYVSIGCISNKPSCVELTCVRLLQDCGRLPVNPYHVDSNVGVNVDLYAPVRLIMDSCSTGNSFSHCC